MEDTVECPKCQESQIEQIECEGAGEGSQHDVECLQCGHWFKFEVSYFVSFNVLD